MEKLSVVIPFFNEAQCFPELKRRLTNVLTECGNEWEVVLVDDHSSDRSTEMARDWALADSRVRFVRLSKNCGPHAGISAGLRYGTGDCAIIMAADLQNPPETIPLLINTWKTGCDIVWVVRSDRAGESRLAKALSHFYYWIMRRIALPQMPPNGTDFLLIDRQVIEAYNAIPEKNTSFLAMIVWLGFRQMTVEYVKPARLAGQSKWTYSKKLRLFVDSLISFSYVPIRFMSAVGVSMALCGFIYALSVVVGRFTGWVVAGTGFAALMTILLVGQGLILTMLGLLGEYLWRTYDEARGRPRYVIQEVVGPEPHCDESQPCRSNVRVIRCSEEK